MQMKDYLNTKAILEMEYQKEENMQKKRNSKCMML